MGILYHDGIEYTDKPKLDKTLSIEGQAADSKAVGDTKISHADVVDNLESTATELPLSANMGRELSDKIAFVEKDNDWVMFKFNDGTFHAVRYWYSGNDISMTIAYGSLYISQQLTISLPKNVISVSGITGNSMYLGGGIGGVNVTDKRASIGDLTDIIFYFWSATSLTDKTRAVFTCYGAWK